MLARFSIVRYSQNLNMRPVLILIYSAGLDVNRDYIHCSLLTYVVSSIVVPTQVEKNAR